MDEFLLRNYGLITHIVEFMAAVTGLILFKKFKNTAVKFFILFLVYISVFDLLCAYTHLVRDNGLLSVLGATPFRSNYWLSTLYWEIGAIVFYSFYFSKIIQTKLYIKIIKYLAYSFTLFSFSIIAINFKNYFNSFFPSIAIFGALTILLCVTLYFIEILKSEHILSFYKSLNFYIGSAILIWWLVTTPLIFYDIYFSEADRAYIILKGLLFLFSNIFMYSTFTFGLIYTKPEHA